MMYITYSTKSDVFVVKINKLTDFVFRSADMKTMIAKYIEKMEKQFPEKIDAEAAYNIFKDFQQEMLETFKEKRAYITYMHVNCDEDVVINCYKYDKLHGKDFEHACIALAYVFADSKIEGEALIDCAADLLGYEHSSLIKDEGNIRISTNMEFKPYNYASSGVSTASILSRHRNQKIYKLLPLQADF